MVHHGSQFDDPLTNIYFHGVTYLTVPRCHRYSMVRNLATHNLAIDILPSLDSESTLGIRGVSHFYLCVVLKRMH